MTEGPRYVTFRDYVRVVRERRLLVLAIVALFGGAAVAYSLNEDPVYAAEAFLEFRDQTVETSLVGRPLSPVGQTAAERAAIAARGVADREVAETVKSRLRSEMSVEALQSAVSARTESQTNLVIITATAATAEGAARLTNAFADAVRSVERERARTVFREAARAQRKVLQSLDRQPSSDLSRVLLRQDVARLQQLAAIADPVTIRSRASVPAAPIRPKPVRTTLLGLVLGLTFALFVAFLRDSLDRRLKSSREILEEMKYPLLGYVRDNTLGRGLVASSGRKAMTEEELEGFRILRANIDFLDVDAPPRLIVVTSAMPGEGKSTISSALSAAYATAGRRTLLVEADLRRPTMAERLGMRTAPGISDYLVGHSQPTDVLQTIAVPSMAGNGQGPVAAPEPVPLVAITAGSPTPQPAELLRSSRARELFAQVKQAYDVVIVDSCPLLSVVDALELVPIADAVVVCVRASQTTREQARAARNALSHFPARPTGVVVTGVRGDEEGAGYGYYSYGYVYGGRQDA